MLTSHKVIGEALLNEFKNKVLGVKAALFKSPVRFAGIIFPERRNANI